MRLNSRAFLETPDTHAPHIKFDWLEGETEGLIALTESAEHMALRSQAKLARQAQHRGPRPLDLLIAAIAQVHGATLLHYDPHFEQIARVTGQPTEWLARPGSLA